MHLVWPFECVRIWSSAIPWPLPLTILLTSAGLLLYRFLLVSHQLHIHLNSVPWSLQIFQILIRPWEVKLLLTFMVTLMKMAVMTGKRVEPSKTGSSGHHQKAHRSFYHPLRNLAVDELWMLLLSLKLDWANTWRQNPENGGSNWFKEWIHGGPYDLQKQKRYPFLTRPVLCCCNVLCATRVPWHRLLHLYGQFLFQPQAHQSYQGAQICCRWDLQGEPQGLGGVNGSDHLI